MPPETPGIVDDSDEIVAQVLASMPTPRRSRARTKAAIAGVQEGIPSLPPVGGGAASGPVSVAPATPVRKPVSEMTVDEQVDAVLADIRKQAGAGTSSRFPFANPEVHSAFSSLIADAKGLGYDVRVSSGDRSLAKQAAMFAKGKPIPGRPNVRMQANGLPVAREGFSNHNDGTAGDLILFKNGKRVRDYSEIIPLAQKYGLYQLRGDPVHFDYRPAKVQRTSDAELRAQEERRIAGLVPQTETAPVDPADEIVAQVLQQRKRQPQGGRDLGKRPATAAMARGELYGPRKEQMGPPRPGTERINQRSVDAVFGANTFDPLNLRERRPLNPAENVAAVVGRFASMGLDDRERFSREFGALQVKNPKLRYRRLADAEKNPEVRRRQVEELKQLHTAVQAQFSTQEGRAPKSLPSFQPDIARAEKLLGYKLTAWQKANLPAVTAFHRMEYSPEYRSRAFKAFGGDVVLGALGEILGPIIKGAPIVGRMAARAGRLAPVAEHVAVGTGTGVPVGAAQGVLNENLTNPVATPQDYLRAGATGAVVGGAVGGGIGAVTGAGTAAVRGLRELPGRVRSGATGEAIGDAVLQAERKANPVKAKMTVKLTDYPEHRPVIDRTDAVRPAKPGEPTNRKFADQPLRVPVRRRGPAAEAPEAVPYQRGDQVKVPGLGRDPEKVWTVLGKDQRGNLRLQGANAQETATVVPKVVRPASENVTAGTEPRWEPVVNKAAPATGEPIVQPGETLRNPETGAEMRVQGRNASTGKIEVEVLKPGINQDLEPGVQRSVPTSHLKNLERQVESPNVATPETAPGTTTPTTPEAAPLANAGPEGGATAGGEAVPPQTAEPAVGEARVTPEGRIQRRNAEPPLSLDETDDLVNALAFKRFMDEAGSVDPNATVTTPPEVEEFFAIPEERQTAAMDALDDPSTLRATEELATQRAAQRETELTAARRDMDVNGDTGRGLVRKAVGGDAEWSEPVVAGQARKTHRYWEIADEFREDPAALERIYNELATPGRLKRTYTTSAGKMSLRDLVMDMKMMPKDAVAAPRRFVSSGKGTGKNVQRTVTLNVDGADRTATLNAKQARRFDALDAEMDAAQARVKQAQERVRSTTYNTAERGQAQIALTDAKKAARAKAMQIAAEKREITGLLTAKEKIAASKKAKAPNPAKPAPEARAMEVLDSAEAKIKARLDARLEGGGEVRVSTNEARVIPKETPAKPPVEAPPASRGVEPPAVVATPSKPEVAARPRRVPTDEHIYEQSVETRTRRKNYDDALERWQESEARLKAHVEQTGPKDSAYHQKREALLKESMRLHGELQRTPKPVAGVAITETGEKIRGLQTERSLILENEKRFTSPEARQARLDAIDAETNALIERVEGGGKPTAEARAMEVLDSAEAKIKARLDARRGRLLNPVTGIDPEDLADYVALGAIKIAKGAVKFSAWGKAMIADLGEEIRPHLKDLWERSRAYHDNQLDNDLPRLAAEEAPTPRPRTSGAEAPPRTPPGDEPPVLTPPGEGGRSGQGDEKYLGSINTERWFAPEDSRADMLDFVERRATDLERQRRGTVTHEQTTAAAQRLGMTVQEARNIRPGKALNDAELVALGDVADQMEQRLLAAARRVTDEGADSTRAMLEYSVAQNEYDAAMLALNGARSEAGRALNALKIAKKSLRTLTIEDLIEPSRAPDPVPPFEPPTVDYTAAPAPTPERTTRLPRRNQANAANAQGVLLDVQAPAPAPEPTGRTQPLSKVAGLGEAEQVPLPGVDAPQAEGASRAPRTASEGQARTPRKFQRFGETNQVFTKERAAAAIQRIKEKLGKIPGKLVQGAPDALVTVGQVGYEAVKEIKEILPELIEVGGYIREGGIRTFPAWARAMREAIGEEAQQLADSTLREIWNAIRPEAEKRLRTKHQQGLVLKKVLAELGGRDELLKNAEALRAATDGNDPFAVAKWFQDRQKMTFREGFNRFHKGNLLMNPLAIWRNINSTTANLQVRPVTNVLSHLLDIPIAALEKRPPVGNLKATGVGVVASIKEGVPNGLRAWKEVIRHGMTESQAARLDVPRKEFPGGAKNPWNLIFRLMNDSLFKEIAYTGELAERAYAQAAKEGLKGADLERRFLELREDPTLMARAQKVAEYYTYNSRDNDLGEAILRLKRTRWFGPVLDFVIPFSTTPANDLRLKLHYSPLGVLRMFTSDAEQLAKLREPGARAEILAQAAIGTAGLVAAASVIGNSDITGAVPYDPGARAAFYDSGRRPYAIKVPVPGKDIWISYSNMPWTSLLGTVAAIKENHWRKGKPTPASQYWDFTRGFLKSYTDQSFLSGLTALSDFMEDPERNAARWLGQAASGVIPMSALLRTVNNVTDENLRKPAKDKGLAGDVLEQVGASIPGVSQTLPKRINSMGEEAKRNPAGLGALQPYVTGIENDDPVRAELTRLKVFPIPSANKVQTRQGTVTLSGQQQEELARAVGTAIRKTVQRIINTEGYAARSDASKARYLTAAVRAVGSGARAKYLHTHGIHPAGVDPGLEFATP